MTIITKNKWKKIWATIEGQKILDDCEKAFGKYKKIQSLETGKSYKIPTRQILVYGIKGTDLEKYPEWEEKDE